MIIPLFTVGLRKPDVSTAAAGPSSDVVDVGDVDVDDGFNDEDDDGPDDVDAVEDDDEEDSFLGFNATGAGANAGELTLGAKMLIGSRTPWTR